MADQTTIFNLALTELGADMISDPAEDANRSRALAAVYDIAAEATALKFGFARAFTLPADPYCLRALRHENDRIKFKVAGRQLYSVAAAFVWRCRTRPTMAARALLRTYPIPRLPNSTLTWGDLGRVRLAVAAPRASGA